MALPKRIWIHPDDSLQLYITNAIDGAAPYIREPEPCVWKMSKTTGTVWRAHDRGVSPITRPWKVVASWTYCPYCGGRIVIEESES